MFGAIFRHFAPTHNCMLGEKNGLFVLTSKNRKKNTRSYNNGRKLRALTYI
jgi:hydrogenase maturation factor HypF (carbamoyltransferase family)